MIPGTRYTNLKTRRVAEIVGINERYVEYRYLELKRVRGNGRRRTRPNVACVDRAEFEKHFQVVTT